MTQPDPSLAAGVDRLCRRFSLDAGSRQRLVALAEGLAADPHAPTTIRGVRDVLDRHLADSLVALELEPVATARTLADLGAGAGFPGLALAAALPDARVFAVESVGRKCAFIRSLAASAELTNVVVVHARAEEWHAGLEAVDVVTARALAPLGVLVEYAAPLLRLGGHLVAWKGHPEPEEVAGGERAAARLGLRSVRTAQVEPFEGAEHRTLHLYSKESRTPAGFPRRAGMAVKRPL